jgi:hypothetical protein
MGCVGTKDSSIELIIRENEIVMGLSSLTVDGISVVRLHFII